MTKVSSIGQGLYCSISQLAAEFGMTRETVSKRLADAHAVPQAGKGGRAVYRLKDVWAFLLGGASASGEPDPDRLDPFKRQAHYRAEHLKLQIGLQTRELIPRLEVEQEQARIMRVMQRMLDTLPDVIERDAGVPPEIVVLIEKTVDAFREELRAALAEGEDDEAMTA